MGTLVEKLAPEHGCTVAAIAEIDRPLSEAAGSAGPVDVAIDFSQPAAVAANLTELAARRISVVIGTTGWDEHEREMREAAGRSGIGVLAAANFSLGMHVFTVLVEEAARRFGALHGIGAWVHETHHASKIDAPSGTALMLRKVMEDAGYPRPVNMSSTRAGYVPGTHEIGFDGPAETVTLTHAVRDRSVFAHGALEAAKWLKGRQGWFTMRDMING
ncbi:MAG: dihydrodipicolinate reductase [Acidobacteria bacterium]|nr:dihydrodipicolinate reductase [Acidobacteriota bacterium]